MNAGDIIVVFVGGLNIVGRLTTTVETDQRKYTLSEPSMIRPTKTGEIGVYPMGGTLLIQPTVLTFHGVNAAWNVESKDLKALYETYEQDIKKKRLTVGSGLVITNMMPSEQVPR